MITRTLVLLVAIGSLGGACNDARITSLQSFDDPYGLSRAFSLGAVARRASIGAPTSHYLDSLRMRAQMMRQNHEMTMSIIRAMPGGDSGTVYDHYEDGIYKGTW